MPQNKKTAPLEVLFSIPIDQQMKRRLIQSSYNQTTLVVLSLNNLFTAVETVCAHVVATVSFTCGRFFR